MNGKQVAALGPKYAAFKSIYGRSSGVALRCALAYEINVDAFTRVQSPRAITGTLVLKVWTKKSTWRMLWCYVAETNGNLTCFPVFRSANPESDRLAQTLMATPLGTPIEAAFAENSRSRPYCTGTRPCFPSHTP